MVRKRQLTWMADSRRWRKKYKGKPYYLIEQLFFCKSGVILLGVG